jgi:hypothetical protein
VVPAALGGLDELGVEDLVLPLFARRAQPRGVGGLVDWRLGGWLAAQLRDGRITGDRDETVLTTGQGRIGPTRLFLLGLGPPVEEGALRGRWQEAVGMLADAGARAVAIAPPVGSPSESAASDRVLAEGWIDAVATAGRDLELIVFLDHQGRLGQQADALAETVRGRGLLWTPK